MGEGGLAAHSDTGSTIHSGQEGGSQRRGRGVDWHLGCYVRSILKDVFFYLYFALRCLLEGPGPVIS